MFTLVETSLSISTYLPYSSKKKKKKHIPAINTLRKIIVYKKVHSVKITGAFGWTHLRYVYGPSDVIHFNGCSNLLLFMRIKHSFTDILCLA